MLRIERTTKPHQSDDRTYVNKLMKLLWSSEAIAERAYCVYKKVDGARELSPAKLGFVKGMQDLCFPFLIFFSFNSRPKILL